MSHVLVPLSYGYEALEPHMDAQTVHLHHSAHHNSYVVKLNAALADDEERKGLDLASLQYVAGYAGLAVRNNGGGHYNHCLYWQNMAPIGSANTKPFGGLEEKIDQTWGSFDKFKEAFSQAAIGRFASGWAFLTLKSDGTLVVHNTPNHDNPLMETVSDVQGIPILTCDVWEHAYYLKYQNRRNEFVENWWKLVNWDAVVNNYEQYALQGRPVPF